MTRGRSQRPAALLALLTVAAGVVLAHEGHEPIASKGVTIQGDRVKLSPAAQKLLDLRTVVLAERTLERTVPAPASVVLRPQAHAFATAQLPGRIEEVRVKPGQEVKADEVLATVNSRKLDELVLELATARAELDLAVEARKRADQLLRGGVGGPLDLLAAQNRELERENAVLVAELKLRALGLNPREIGPTGGAIAASGNVAVSPRLLPIRSPIAGVVPHVDIYPGMIVTPDEHLLDVVDPAGVWVRVDVPEAYVPQVRLDAKHPTKVYLRLAAYADRKEPFEGMIKARDGRIDPKTLAEPVWVEVQKKPDDPPLIAGMSGQAQIVVERVEKAVAVPESALVRDGMETYVFIRWTADEYLRRPVLLGLAVPGYVQAKSGLFENTAVLTQGKEQLAALFVHGTLSPSQAARANAGLKWEPVRRRAIDRTLELDATLELPTRSADLMAGGKAVVAAPVAGKVVEILATGPGEIRADQPLARLASLELQNLQLELIKADLDAKLARQTLDRYQKADSDGKSLVFRQPIQEATTKLRTAEARMESLVSRLRAIGLHEEIDRVLSEREISGSVVLRAPPKAAANTAAAGATDRAIPVGGSNRSAIPAAGGSAGEAAAHSRPLALGQVVKEGTPLFEVQDASEIWVRAPAFEQNWPALKVGQKARLRLAADPGVMLETEVSRIDTLPEADRRSRSVWARLDNREHRLRENQLGRLTVVIEPAKDEVLAVPLSALYRDGSRAYVFVREEYKDKDGTAKDRFHFRPVKIGRRDDQFIEVLGGLQEGDHVAVSGVNELRRGFGRVK